MLNTLRSSRVYFTAAIAFALAAGLRFWQLRGVSLNHFDEGVLVSGAFGVWLNGPWHFPLAQPLQAPPLFPWMVAGMFSLTQTASPIIAVYLSALLGSATVAVYFLLLRRWYSGRFAIIAAAMLAASDLHVAFSRMALTDVALTFWFVVGAYVLARFVDVPHRGAGTPMRGGFGRMLAGGCALGFVAGAAWNTKYNGWMLIAIAGTAWLLVFLRQSLRRRVIDFNKRNAPPPRKDERPYGPASRTATAGEGRPPVHGHLRAGASDPFASYWTLSMIAVAGSVCLACFAPWYLHVERTFQGGYAAVTANHWSYVGGLADWPPRAARLWLSLTAFRHLGWVATVLGGITVLLWQIGHGCVARQASAAAMSVKVLVGLLLLGDTFVLGSDAVVTIVATGAIVPALIWGRWPEILFAVWAGAFFILTPFYHPYTRLLVPASPAAIALAMWMLERAFTTDRSRGQSMIRALLATSSLGLLLAALIWHPFGWLPGRGAWARWSTRQSYRALGDTASEHHLPEDAVVLCQGPPAMTLYLPRQWAPLELVPFHLWLPRIEAGRECYLAVDAWGLYAENHRPALESFVERLECLESVASVHNDLNLVTLLDYLPAAEVARYLSATWPAKELTDARGRNVVLPAALGEPFAELILLYRIDRNCTGLLDKPRGGALH